jgi:hypothetical protein
VIPVLIVIGLELIHMRQKSISGSIGGILLNGQLQVILCTVSTCSGSLPDMIVIRFFEIGIRLGIGRTNPT